MRIRSKAILRANWGNLDPGEESDVPEDLGNALIAAGAAEAVDKPAETASIEPKQETAMKPRTKGRSV